MKNLTFRFRLLSSARVASLLLWLAIFSAPTFASVLPAPPDEEHERWRNEAAVNIRTTWEKLIAAIRIGDVVSASEHVNPRSRTDFLLDAQADITKAYKPPIEVENSWRCSPESFGRHARCFLQFINEHDKPEPLELNFIRLDEVWYLDSLR